MNFDPIRKLPRHETFFTYFYLIVTGIVFGFAVHFTVFHVVPACAYVTVTASVECNDVNCVCYE